MNLVPSSHPALWSVASPIVDFKSVDGWAADLIKLAIVLGGVGLAAPQVGMPYRLFVMRTNAQWLVCVNPVIVRRGADFDTEQEGCLSFPGQFVDVARHRVIDVQYQDESGKTISRTLKGLDARVFAHELDHLQGECILPKPSI
jgi:peptide deformylase